MHLVHAVCFRIHGLSKPDERVLVEGKSGHLRVVLTADPDPYLMHGDTGMALAEAMLTGRLSDEKLKVLDEWITERVSSQRNARREKVGGKACLVVEMKNEVTVTLGIHKELSRFVVCWDAIDKDTMQASVKALVDRVLTSLLLAEECVVGFDRIGQSTVLFRSDGKPVYSFSGTVGSPTVVVSRQLGDGTSDRILSLYQSLEDDAADFKSVSRLLAASLQQADDPLRALLAGWQALEIFVNKTFGPHEQRVFEALAGEGASARQRYAKRIRDVMKNRYGLGDKFALIAAELSPETADDDVQEFQMVKDVRDEVMHGKELDDNRLPVDSVRRLVRTYLRLHLERGPEGRH